MTRLIASAERKAGLAPGTLTPAGYVRSALLAYMAQSLGDLGPESEADGDDPGPWNRLRENVAAMEETTRSRR